MQLDLIDLLKSNNSKLFQGLSMINSKLSVSKIESFSCVDGPGIRTVIFFNNCPLRCKFCHNPEMQQEINKLDINYQKLYKLILNNKPYYKSNGGVTFSGGEPFSEQHVDELIELAKRIKNETKLNLLIYTGYTLEQIIVKWNKSFLDLMDLADYLVDGPFIQEKKCIKHAIQYSRE